MFVFVDNERISNLVIKKLALEKELRSLSQYRENISHPKFMKMHKTLEIVLQNIVKELEQVSCDFE